MRIAVIHNLAAGGAHRRMREQCRRLDAEVVEFTLGDARAFTEHPRRVEWTERAPRLPVALRPVQRYRDLIALRAAWRRLADLVRQDRVDVVFANPCRVLQAPAALIGMSVPTLYFCDEVRRVDHEPEAAAGRARRSRQLYAALYAGQRRLDESGVRAAGRLVTNSRYTAGEIARAYGRVAQPIPLGVPLGFTPVPPEDAQDYLLSVGTLIGTKGHDLAIEAIGRTRGRRPLRIIAPRRNQPEERRLIDLAAHHRVELDIRAGISDDELRDNYRRAHATLYLARAEPFGLVSVEAQACGSPVIVSAEGGLPETIIDGETGWAVAREAAAVAACLDTLDQPTRRADASRRAAAHGAGWTWDRSARAVQAALEEVIVDPA